jgi:ankyrin repeat protein
MMASREGHLPMVLLLLEHGANVNHKTKAGYTSLEMAIAQGRRDVAETLLRAGAKQ